MSARKRGRGPCGGVLEGAVLAALVIFALTYVVVAVGRVPGLSVDRPSAALLGAVVMVAAGVLSPSEAGRAVNGDTLGLLLGTMILSAWSGRSSSRTCPSCCSRASGSRGSTRRKCSGSRRR